MQCIHSCSSSAEDWQKKNQSAPWNPSGEKNTKHLCNSNHCERKQGLHKMLVYQLLFRAESKCKATTIFWFYAKDTDILVCLKSGDQYTSGSFSGILFNYSCVVIASDWGLLIFSKLCHIFLMLLLKPSLKKTKISGKRMLKFRVCIYASKCTAVLQCSFSDILTATAEN